MENVGMVAKIQKAYDMAKNTPKEDLIFTYNGVMYPSVTCDVDTFKTIETFEVREEDLMMIAYPKCGSNWTILLLHSIVYDVYKKKPSALVPLIEFKGSDKFETLKLESSPRVLGSHLHYDNIPQPFFDKKIKMLVVFRNPKDTAVSLFHFYNSNPMLPTYSSWDEFFPDFMAGKVVWGSYFDHAVAWNKHLDEDNVLLITFEDMKHDLEGSVKKITEFLGIPFSEEQAKQVADKGTFKAMKENSGKTHGAFGQIIFRKGDVGDWKNHFSQAQSEEMDAKFEECLAGTKLGEMLKYNVHCKW
ncbi:sulfotransferase 6B1 [Anomaloglossus baeobatrachus]|uniref:sulfotransferase 6B1 n=1 Tax=Anomaloglossus baeobatrachus TaxID=238106 RepID=UPI003F4FB177